MNKLSITNQQLLEELEKRLPDFTENEIITVFKLTITNMPSDYKARGLTSLKEISPQFHDLAQATVRRLDKEKIDKQVDEIKKSLKENKKPCLKLKNSKNKSQKN